LVDFKDFPLTDIGVLGRFLAPLTDIAVLGRTPMSIREESLKSTKDTYVCQRRIFKIDQGHLCLSDTDIGVLGRLLAPLTDIGVLGLFLAPLTDISVIGLCLAILFRPFKDFQIKNKK
jgi:hypothetical protein